MKKTLSTVLIGSMLMMPTPVFATDDDDYIHYLSFNKIEDEIEARNPTIESSRDAIDEGSDKADEQIELITPVKDNLIKRIEDIHTDLQGGTYVKVSGTPSTVNGVEMYSITNNGNTFANLLKGYSAIVVLSPEPSSPSIANLEDYEDYINYNLLKLYVYQLSSLNMQLAQIDAQDDDLWKSYLQVDKAEDQLVWGAQKLYLGYYGLTQTKDNLQTNIDLLKKKLTVQQLRETLGLATHTDVTAAEIQIKELSMTLDKLNQSMADMKGQLNIMLGQDFDTELTLDEPAAVSQSELNDMDYEEDLEDALVQSYDVQLEEDSDDREDAERSFTLAFHQAYQNVQDKKDALELERLKLENEQIKYDQNVLTNSLGLTSNLDFEGLRSVYLTQVNKVKTAEQDLLQAYTAYNWMKEGLTVSTGAGASNASTTSESSSSSAAPSGMGF